MCGGTRGGAGRDRHRTGLSPRVRGNRDYQAQSVWIPGSIPACAGEPNSAVWVLKRDPVYPRVCGGTVEGGQDVFAE